MTEPTIAAELEALAGRIKRMRAVGNNGHLEPFMIDRSEAARDAKLLADWLRTGRKPEEFVPSKQRSPVGGRTSFARR